MSDSLAVTMLLHRRRRDASLPSAMELGERHPCTRKYLTHKQFEAAYGTSERCIARVERFAAKHALDVERTSLLMRTVRLSGAEEDFTKAFGATLDEVEAGVRGTGPRVPLPEELEHHVEWIFPYDRQPQASPRHRFHSSRKKHVHRSLAVEQLVEYYEFPTACDGAGECIGIIALGGGYRREDVDAFLAERGRTSAEIIDDGPNEPGMSDLVDMEVTMDVEIAAAAAPGARIVVYFATGNTIDRWYDVLARAIHDTKHCPSVLSISWSAAESVGWKEEEMAKLDVLLREAALLGITVCAASGDSGTVFPNGFGPFSAVPSTEFPASDPFVLACGGTSLKIKRGRPVAEYVWNSLAETYIAHEEKSDCTRALVSCNGGASGGGVSAYMARPPYQEKVDVPERITATFGPRGLGEPHRFVGRGVPDLAASAGLDTGYVIRYRERDVVGGGTSASAPLVAALVARLNQGLGHRLGFIHPWLYRLQLDGDGSLFRQVKGGGNGGYFADPDVRWNPCTGLGSPRGTAILEALRRTASASSTPMSPESARP